MRKPGPVGRASTAVAAVQGHGDPETGGEGGQRIASVVPGVDLYGRAVDGGGHARAKAKHRFLDADHDQKNRQGKRRRGMVRHFDLAYGCHRDTDGGTDEHECDAQRRQRLGLPVPVGVVFVVGLGGDYQTAPYDHPTDDVTERCDARGD